ncbi:hypothetical protein BC829DRAFT_390240 [Chytridium lagenaria]|nr:hypothetical protein BC829DRAFT_390240 [Chytridium lagenaria]
MKMSLDAIKGETELPFFSSLEQEASSSSAYGPTLKNIIISHPAIQKLRLIFFNITAKFRFILALLTIGMFTNILASSSRITDALSGLGGPYATYPALYLKKAREKFLSGAANCTRSHRGDDVIHSDPETRCGGSGHQQIFDKATLIDKKLPSNASYAEKLTYFVQVLQERNKYPLKKVQVTERPKNYTNQLMEETLAKIAQSDIEESKHRRKRRSSIHRRPPLRISLSKESITSGSSQLICGDLDTDETITERYCETLNVAIDIDKIPAAPSTHPAPLDLNAPFETLTSTCALNETWWFGEKSFGLGGGVGWMFRSMNVKNPSETNEDIQCDAWIETPLFFISRWDTTNPYQAHHDFVNTFRVYAALGLSADEVQPVILDSRTTDGPYLGLWATIFSSSNRILDIRQLSALIASQRDLEASRKRLCIRRAIWGIHGGISPNSRNGSQVDKCHLSPLLQAYSAFVEDRLRVQMLGSDGAGRSVVGPVTSWPRGPKRNRTPLAVIPVTETGTVGPMKHTEVPLNLLRVTYAIRNSTTSATPLQKSKLMDTPLIDYLEQVVTSWSPMERLFRAVDFATLSVEAQISIAQDTDVFIGPHGAVFIYLLYLRREPVAGVFELQPPERSLGNEQFMNMASRMGHRYRRWAIKETINQGMMRDIGEQLVWLLEEVGGLRGKAVAADRDGMPYEVPHRDGHVFTVRKI